MQVHVQKQQIMTNNEDQHHRPQYDKSRPTKLITTYEQILQEYPDVFEGIGKFLGPPYHINIDPASNPQTNPMQTNTSPP